MVGIATSLSGGLNRLGGLEMGKGRERKGHVRTNQGGGAPKF